MELKKNLFFYLSGLIIALLVGLILYGTAVRRSYELQLASLRNEVAQKDATVEIKDGLYHKLTVESESLKDSLDQKDSHIKDLESELKKKNLELLSVNQLALTWKKAYEGSLNSKQTDVPSDSGVVRKKVEFEKDFGYIGVKGYTLTDPPEAWAKISQNRPLRLTLALSEDASHVWHTHVTSSEENVGIQIELSAVNPHLLEPKWYESFGVTTNLAGGTTQDGFGVLVGVGLTYSVGKFEIGPAAWLGISRNVDRYFGATFLWHPFQRN
jgi:hypothetical protein